MSNQRPSSPFDVLVDQGESRAALQDPARYFHLGDIEPFAFFHTAPAVPIVLSIATTGVFEAIVRTYSDKVFEILLRPEDSAAALEDPIEVFKRHGITVVNASGITSDVALGVALSAGQTGQVAQFLRATSPAACTNTLKNSQAFKDFYNDPGNTTARDGVAAITGCTKCYSIMKDVRDKNQGSDLAAARLCACS